MLTIQSAHTPTYASADGNIISLMVKFAEFDEELPFGASPNDVMTYGVDIFNRAKAGEFGEIAPYVAPATFEQPKTTGTQTL